MAAASLVKRTGRRFGGFARVKSAAYTPPGTCRDRLAEIPWNNVRAPVKAFFGRWKRVIGNGLRFRTEDRRNTGIAIPIRVLNYMLDPGRPDFARIA